MNPILPTELGMLLMIGSILLATVLAGFFIARMENIKVARAAGWVLAVTAVAGVERLCAYQPAGFRMLAIIGVLLYAMKAVVAREAVQTGGARLALPNWLAFAMGWFGMRSTIFSKRSDRSQAITRELLISGAKQFLLGSIFLFVAGLIWRSNIAVDSDVKRLLATLLMLPGISLMLHFGFFNTLAGLWRRYGFDCDRLFRAPLLATSLSEFWGRRWNLAFSEMTAIGVYRPLSDYAGRNIAVVVAFLFSGLLHELAISVPVKAGLGLPMLYFLLHGLLVIVERWLYRSGRRIDSVKWVGRAWTIFWLVLPMPILFHREFLAKIIWPIIGMD